MPDFPVIDIHVHTYPDKRIGMQAKGGDVGPSGHAGTIEELVPYMDSLGISHAAMMNFTPVADMVYAARARLPEEMTPEERLEQEEPIRIRMVERVKQRNVWTCDVAKAHQGLIAFIGVDTVMDGETMYSEVVDKANHGAKGIKIHPEVQRVSINDPLLWPAYRAAEELGMIVLSHAGPFGTTDGTYSHPSMAAEVLGDFPNLKLILAHLGGRTFYRAAVRLASAFPKLLFDCCGLVRPEQGGLPNDELVGMFRELGVHRILYGSDWASGDAAPDIQRLMTLPLSDEEKRMILQRNAEILLEL